MKKLFSVLLVAALLSFLVVSLASAWTEVIIESREGGQNFSWYSETGTFANSSAKSTAPGVTPGIGSRYCSTADTVRIATYQPVFDTPGMYEVFVTWGTSTTGGDAIEHKVTYQGGATSISIWNQNSSAGYQNQWNSLGVFAFDLSGGKVEQRNTNPVAGFRMMPDAVKFVYTGPLVPEPSSMLALASGLAGMAGLVIRRKR